MLIFSFTISAALLQVKAAQPSVDEILDRYAQALGGKAAVEKVTSRVMKGTVDNPDEGTSDPFEIYSKAPDRYVMISDSGNSQEAVDGETGWVKSSDSGMHSMSRSDLAVAKREYGFYRETRLKDLYPKMTVSGEAKVGNRDAYVIEATPSAGPAEKLYFDKQTGLLLKRDFERVSFDEGITAFEVFYEDYRDADGVKIPFLVRRTTPDYTLIYKISDVKSNVPIDDAKFRKPAK